MTEKEVKIYVYKISIVEGNIKIEEIVFNAIEKQKTYILKQDGDNTTKRVVYNLNEPIEDSIVSEKRDNFFRGRRTLKKDELNELNNSPFEDALYIYYSEPSLEKAMPRFKKTLGNRSVRLGIKINELTIKKQTCEKFVADTEELLK
jgi:hypothetical protein